jgi:hypothetical protein
MTHELLYTGVQMKFAIYLLATATIFAASCKGKGDKPADNPPKPAESAAEPPKSAAEPPKAAAEPPKAAAEPPKSAAPPADMVEHDLSPFGPEFKGYVATAPKTAKIEFDDPSRHIVLSDVTFVVVDEAPNWEEGIAELNKDKDNSNIQKVSATEVRYERNPPIGKMWMVDMLVKIGKAKYSCGTGLTGPDSKQDADLIETICKSIKKK